MFINLRFGFACAVFCAAMMSLGCSGGYSSPEELVIAENGSCEYTFVVPDKVPPRNGFIIKDVTGFLSKAIGREIAVTNFSAAPKSKCIYYSIAPEGFDLSSLKAGEYCVIAKNGNVHLFGFGQNGARYAAYSWLQKDLGFRFFDMRGGVKIPQGRLAMKCGESHRRFDFAFRSLSGGSGTFNSLEPTLFLFRQGQVRGMSAVLDEHKIAVPRDDQVMCPLWCHSMHYFLPPDGKSPTFDWVKKQNLPDMKSAHPEYFSMNREGKRVFNSQYCLSNPGLRKLLKERVLRYMEDESRRSDIFDVSANDTGGQFCYCPDCQKLVKEYGTVGAPVIDFMRELCPEAKARFPHAQIMTLIYRKSQTQPPPTNVEVLPDNFTPDFAPIDDNFSKDWSDPSNAQTYADLKRWCKLCKNVIVWYYPNPYGGELTPPLGNVERGVRDLFLMKEAGVTGHLWEHNVGVIWGVGFTELQTYVWGRLMNDMSLNWRELADEFIEFKYGAAGEMFKKYWLELEKLTRDPKEVAMLRWNASPLTYSHLTPERLVRWNTDFDRMEALVADDPERLFAVRRVRINLDYAIMLDFLKVRKAGLKISSDVVAKRMMDTAKRIAAEFKPGQKRYEKKAQDFLKRLGDDVESARLQSSREPLPLPKAIFGGIEEKRLFTVFPKINEGKETEKCADDPKAAWGVCAVYNDNGLGAKMPIRGATTDYTTRYCDHLGIIKDRGELPPKGEYKFFRMGTTTLTTDFTFRCGSGRWWDFMADLSRAWQFGSRNRVEVWISLKFEGPEFYPEDKGKPNRVFCDRVVVVREKEED
jgi:hypothetical protein